MNNESKPGMETLMGGKGVTVKLQDGRSCNVWVRQLPIEDYAKLLGMMEDEHKQVGLYCRPAAAAEDSRGPEAALPQGWERQLTAESHDLVMETAEELNKDFFGRWLRRRMSKIESMRPGLTQELFRSLTAGAGSQKPGSGPLSNTSPALPPTAG